MDNLAVKLSAVEYVSPASLKGYPGHARVHSKAKIRQLARGMRAFGPLVPLLAEEDGQLITGHGRLLAAQFLKLEELPVIRIKHLTKEQIRAFRLADNKLTEIGEWDPERLGDELRFLMSAEINFDVDLTGFSVPEIDFAIGGSKASVSELPLPMPPEITISRLGDLWKLGTHRVLCADSRDLKNLAKLMGSEKARMVLTDPPYNVSASKISGLGKYKHKNFAMAAGEMSDGEFAAFLKDVLGMVIVHCEDGALVFTFMNWSHLRELQDACQALGLTPINLCIWVKSNGGMGSLYRSQHELVWITKYGKAPHRNHVELGKHGRYRTNVWEYAGMNSFGAERDAALIVHPTVKPVALLVDAIRDVSDHGEIILDPFLGSGSTLIAAEEARRRCYGLELEPKYVDVILQRWQQKTAAQPILVETGEALAAVRKRRTQESPPAAATQATPISVTASIEEH